MNAFTDATQQLLAKLGLAFQGLSLLLAGVLVGYVMQVKDDVTTYLVIVTVWAVVVVFTWSRTRYMSIIRAYQAMDHMYFKQRMPLESDTREFIDTVHQRVYELYQGHSKEIVHQGVIAFFESDLLNEWVSCYRFEEKPENQSRRVED